MIQIEAAPINMRNQKILSVEAGYIHLHEDSLEYKLDFICERFKDMEDENLGTEEERTFIHMISRKDSIVGIEMALTQYSQYRLTVSVQGVVQDQDVFFRKKDLEKCTQAFDEINKWLFNKKD